MKDISYKIKNISNSKYRDNTNNLGRSSIYFYSKSIRTNYPYEVKPNSKEIMSITLQYKKDIYGLIYNNNGIQKTLPSRYIDYIVVDFDNSDSLSEFADFYYKNPVLNNIPVISVKEFMLLCLWGNRSDPSLWQLDYSFVKNKYFTDIVDKRKSRFLSVVEQEKKRKELAEKIRKEKAEKERIAKIYKDNKEIIDFAARIGIKYDPVEETIDVISVKNDQSLITFINEETKITQQKRILKGYK